MTMMNNDDTENKEKKEVSTDQIAGLKNRVKYIERQIDSNKKLLTTLANTEDREIAYYRKRMENYNNLKNNKNVFRKSGELEAYYMSSRTRLNKLEDDMSKMKKEIINLESEREGLIKNIGELIVKNDREGGKSYG